MVVESTLATVTVSSVVVKGVAELIDIAIPDNLPIDEEIFRILSGDGVTGARDIKIL